jgi:hypothetical protein
MLAFWVSIINLKHINLKKAVRIRKIRQVYIEKKD